MNLLKITLLIIIIFIAFGCNNEIDQNDLTNNNSTNQAVEKDVGIYTVEFSVDPPTIVSGQPVKMEFRVKDPNGETYSDLELLHEKPMHLYIVSEDLSQFFHQHPTKNDRGVFEDSFTFPNGGKFKIFVDLKPKNSSKLVDSYDLSVSGDTRENVEITPDDKFEKTVEGLRVPMKPDGDLVSNKELILTFQVFDAVDNKPVTDLQDYLGAKAHFVVISKDLKDFVHIHPMSNDNVKSEEHVYGDNHTEMEMDEKLAGESGESNVSAMVEFPKAGIYRIFATFKRKDKITIVPFTFEVKEGNEEKPIDLSNVKIPDGAFKIVVSKNGFTPQEISYKSNELLKLAFYRADEENCKDEIVFKDLNIRKELPVGKVVLIDIPTKKKGEINFACNNEMLKGKIIIQ